MRKIWEIMKKIGRFIEAYLNSSHYEARKWR